MPETVDLLLDKIVGVVCDSKRIREETFINLVIMIAVTLSPEDIILNFIFFQT